MFQGLREVKGDNAVGFVDLIVHQFELAFGGDSEGLADLGLGVQRFAVEFKFDLGVFVLPFDVVQLEVVLTVAEVGGGDVVFVDHGRREDLHGFLVVDGLAEEHLDVILGVVFGEGRLHLIDGEHLGTFLLFLLGEVAGLAGAAGFVAGVQCADHDDAQCEHHEA